MTITKIFIPILLLQTLFANAQINTNIWSVAWSDAIETFGNNKIQGTNS